MSRIVAVLCLGIALAATQGLAAAPEHSDGSITARTKLSLWTTAGVRSTTVHVDTTDGVVTLYGKVPTEAQRALAAKTTGEISGVRSVQNMLQVVALKDEKLTAKTDKDIKEAGEKAIKEDAALSDSRIEVKSVDKGIVLLTGKANTYADHLRAIVLVDRLVGVRRIASEVTLPGDFAEDERITFVTPAAAKANAAKSNVADSRISMQVKLRLLTAAEVPSTEISVDTNDRVVTLFGIVPTNDVKRAAGNEAGKVSDVRLVDNQLEVVASSAKKAVDAKDDDITSSLVLAFKSRPELKGVTTSVKNGMVMVTGTVPTGWDRLHALRLVRRVEGVRAADDQLKVESAPQMR